MGTVCGTAAGDSEPMASGESSSAAALASSKGQPFWPSDADVPRIYDPPQLKPEYAGWATVVDALSHRSVCCAYPAPPCCLA
eukprot:CAMPEP_0119431454 /NCGR_PEP_ID=MMETSP1335-20130426/45965_1 /TAXON_ID=259385 /ORGANISM="Chrysoculter rhomboideus, Strain RCC1486" /LENGTH=81 /DNA_ID=CAMNT_0007457249 /DNA_START=23 /DNA_END=265 /DNA_ORIENTATION=+